MHLWERQGMQLYYYCAKSFAQLYVQKTSGGLVTRGIVRLIGIGLILLPACSGCPNLGSSSDNSVPVVVQTVVESQSSPQVIVYGVVNPSNRAEIQFPRQVKIDQVFVNVGDSVAAGAPLIKLSDDDLTLQLNQLRAQKKEVEANLDKGRYLLTNKDKLLQEGKIDATQAGGLDTDVKANEALLDRIKTDLSVIEHDLGAQTITSPIAGQVVDRKATPGMQYAAKDVVLTIANMDPVTMVFPVAIDDAPGISAGTPVAIKMEDVNAAPMQSVVSYIGPTVNPISKTFDAWASLPNPQGLLKINMRGTVEFTSNVTHKVFVVPAASLTMRENDAVLYIVKGGLARKTPVVVRQVSGDKAVLDSGVQSGDLIVVKGWEKLQDGSAVDLRR